MPEKRNIAVAIILSIVTFGIYDLIWFVKMTNEVNSVTENENDTSGGMALFLTIITFGLYGFYWAYKMGEKLDDYEEKHESRALLYLLLEIFGLGIVTFILIQDSLNSIIEGR